MLSKSSCSSFFFPIYVYSPSQLFYFSIPSISQLLPLIFTFIHHCSVQAASRVLKLLYATVTTLYRVGHQSFCRTSPIKKIYQSLRSFFSSLQAEGVKSRLSALALAAELEAVALRSRIRHKQDASQLRLESHLQAIREKATHPRQPVWDMSSRILFHYRLQPNCSSSIHIMLWQIASYILQNSNHVLQVNTQ